MGQTSAQDNLRAHGATLSGKSIAWCHSQASLAQAESCAQTQCETLHQAAEDRLAPIALPPCQPLTRIAEGYCVEAINFHVAAGYCAADLNAAASGAIYRCMERLARTFPYNDYPGQIPTCAISDAWHESRSSTPDRCVQTKPMAPSSLWQKPARFSPNTQTCLWRINPSSKAALSIERKGQKDAEAQRQRRIKLYGGKGWPYQGKDLSKQNAPIEFVPGE